MALSSNSLIHFTMEKDSLKGILQDNFKIFYCKETIDVGDGVFEFYTPMVSFCDIPLSEVKNHIDRYGQYGIGLTKEWGNRKGLNPVLYTSSGSNLTRSIDILIEANLRKSPRLDDWTDNEKALADITRYIKNYEGKLIRKGSEISKYRFSDEREWRYVPPFSEKCNMVSSVKYYKSNKDNVNRKVESMRLEFEPNDIKYIIIKDDSEIGELVEHLRKEKGKRYSMHDVERLTTRIITTEQIRTDI